tara:strand:- start:23 stop:940 length:918 start_codon:yes stop_codon:yes gene_type:complete
MIIHHNEDIKSYHLFIQKPLKYSDKFTFIPIILKKDNDYLKCIFQTPLLFTPYGIKKTQNNKDIIDISFQNIDNDKSQSIFHKNLKYIYDCVYNKYKYDYIVNDFLKKTDFNDCLRLKINSTTKIFDNSKNILETINNYSYGNFIIELEGLWLNEDNIWFQWNLLQAKIKLSTHLREYSFIDEIVDHKKKDDKYDKMLKMGVPKEAVERQRTLDGKENSNKRIPKPPPPPPPYINKGILSEISTSTASTASTTSMPKINASDLRNVVLKKGKPIHKNPIKKESNHFEPPTLEELQTTLSRLRKTK